MARPSSQWYYLKIHWVQILNKAETVKVPVVVVDDDEASRYLVKRAIKNLDLVERIVEFEAGDHFLEVFRNDESRLREIGVAPPPILVLLDINMPRLTGFDVLASLKETLGSDTRTIVVTMYSSSAQAEDRDDSMKYPFVKDYIEKPVTSERLSEIVEKYCLTAE